MSDTRPTWVKYFSQMATLVATRSTCVRRQVGCVIVDGENRVLATGYNGALPGQDQCDEVGCFMHNGHCERCNHAEINAITDAARRGAALSISVAYVTLQPCMSCLRALVSAGVRQVYYNQAYGEHSSLYHELHDVNCVCITDFG